MARSQVLIPNTFQTPNAYVDELLPILTGTEVKVLLFVARKTFGWGKPTESLTIAEVMAAVGASRGGVSSALNRLVAMRVVTRTGEAGYEFLYGLQLDRALFVLPGDAGGCTEITHPPADPHPENDMTPCRKVDGGHPENEGGTPYTLNPPLKTQEETQGGYISRVRPPVLKPSQLLAAEQAESPSWRALVREADSPPVPGAEHERWTATWRNLQDWAVNAGLDDAALAGEIHARARRYPRKFTTPFTIPALGALWAALAHDPPPKSPAEAARASPGDTEALIAAQPPKTRRLYAAGQRFIERGEHGQDAVFRAFLPPGGGDQQGAERRADGAVVREVRHLPGGDVHGGGQPRDG